MKKSNDYLNPKAFLKDVRTIFAQARSWSGSLDPTPDEEHGISPREIYEERCDETERRTIRILRRGFGL